jgi:hypothetical protein
MSNTAFQLDDREFKAALVQYAAASGKDFADISNAKVQESCFWAAKKAPKAKGTEISSLLGEDKFIWWLAKKLRGQEGAGGMYDAQTRAIKTIKRRKSSVSFVKAFFLIMASMLAPYTGKGGRRKSGSMKGFAPYIKPATSSRPDAEAGVRFTTSNYTSEDKGKVEKILLTAMQGGLTASAANMMQYVDRKTGATAAKYSAK